MFESAGALGVLVAFAGGVWMGPPLVHRLLQRVRTNWTCRRRRRIALTFDDGPGFTLTPDLLELLGAFEAHATFFMLGARAELNPDTVRLVVDLGHEIGTHSGRHLNAWKVSPWASVRDLAAGSRVSEIAGVRARVTRPPYGKMTLATWLSELLRGRRIAWWTVDSGDTWENLPDPKLIARSVVERGGGVVLLHDFDRAGHSRPTRHAYVLEVTRELLLAGRGAAFEFCRYSDLRRRRAVAERA